MLQGRRELDSFFARWYGPSRLTIAVVGDATADQARLLTRTALASCQEVHLYSDAWLAHTGSCVYMSFAEHDMSLASPIMLSKFRYIEYSRVC